MLPVGEKKKKDKRATKNVLYEYSILYSPCGWRRRYRNRNLVVPSPFKRTRSFVAVNK